MAVVSDYGTSILAHLGSLLGVGRGKPCYVDLPAPTLWLLSAKEA